MATQGTDDDAVDMVIINRDGRGEGEFRVILGRVGGKSEAYHTDKLEIDL